MSVQITRVASDADVQGILDLQQANLKKNLTPEAIDSQGFVTLEHNFEIMRKMNNAVPSIIAKDGDKVVGYALVMLPSFKNDIPALEGLFESITKITYKGKNLATYNYVVVGQLCVGMGYRGIGLVNTMYANYKEILQYDFDMAITDISSKNPRSVKAHEKAGFQVVHTFYDEHAQENWLVVVYDWMK